MRAVIYAASIVVALSASPVGATSHLTPHERCVRIADFAEQVMTLRQDGYSAAYTLEESMGAIEGMSGWGKPEQKMARWIVGEAYQFPRYRSMSRYHDAISTFTDQTFLACMQGADPD